MVPGGTNEVCSQSITPVKAWISMKLFFRHREIVASDIRNYNTALYFLREQEVLQLEQQIDGIVIVKEQDLEGVRLILDEYEGLKKKEKMIAFHAPQGVLRTLGYLFYSLLQEAIFKSIYKRT